MSPSRTFLSFGGRIARTAALKARLPVRRRYATEAIAAGLKVDADRLWSDIHSTCEWGTGKRWGEASHETGMSRLALSDADKQARDWFVATTRELGCKVTIDAVGNIFAVRPGRRGQSDDAPPTYAGSHLDTQPTGGRYDGILGVTAGIEALRTMKENNIETEFPVGVINWTNEEGARFPRSMMASGVWAGAIPLEEVYSLKEVGDGGRTVKQELERIGYLGDTPASHRAMPIGAHFELHIEQGPILEQKDLKIGVVSGVQAYKWYELSVFGRDCHTGTTPWSARRDPLLAAARLLQIARDRGMEMGGLASVGILRTFPGSINTVPGRVDFTLDIRAPDDRLQAELDRQIFKDFDEYIAETNRGHGDESLSLESRRIFDSAAVHFDADCIRCVRESAEHNFGPSQTSILSGAGHDSVFASKHAPTSMIFVPCRNGVSHHPEEYCAPQDCANGAQVLMESMLRFDALRAERSR